MPITALRTTTDEFELDCIEQRLRLLALQRRQSLKSCERFMSELEAAMEKAEREIFKQPNSCNPKAPSPSVAANTPIRGMRALRSVPSDPSAVSAYVAACDQQPPLMGGARSGPQSLVSSRQPDERSMKAVAVLPSWLADTSYYEKVSRRRPGSPAQSHGPPRRPARRRSFEVASSCDRIPLASSGPQQFSSLKNY